MNGIYLRGEIYNAKLEKVKFTEYLTGKYSPNVGKRYMNVFKGYVVRRIIEKCEIKCLQKKRKK